MKKKLIIVTALLLALAIALTMSSCWGARKTGTEEAEAKLTETANPTDAISPSTRPEGPEDGELPEDAIEFQREKADTADGQSTSNTTESPAQSAASKTTSTPAVTPTPTASTKPTVTPTPTPTPTASPKPTVSPTPSPTPEPFWGGGELELPEDELG